MVHKLKKISLEMENTARFLSNEKIYLNGK